MSELQMLAVAYVFFLGLIGVEFVVSVWRRDPYYSLGEFVVNIGHGVLYQVFDHLTKALVIIPFMLVCGLVSWSVLPTDALWAWVVGLLIYDLSSYWCHRHHHEVHVLWAIHGVHHAAEDFNLAAALRQPAFQRLTGWLWRVPLALVMPFEMFVALVLFDFLYQFLLHTRYVPTMGAFGWVFNTPSHHRVHHGMEPKYLDRNYGGILIIWDRLFGTFQAEEEEPTYGVTKPLRSLNALWGNFAMHAELWQAMQRTTGIRRLWVWLAGPSRLAEIAPDHVYEAPPIADRQLPLPLRLYVMVTGGTLPPLLAWMLLVGDGWDLSVRVALATYIVASVVAAGALLERRRWAISFEAIRVIAAVVGVSAVLGTGWPVLPGLVWLGVFALALGDQSGARVNSKMSLG